MDPSDLTCRELVELVTDYFEDALEADERERFEAHLAACEACRLYIEQMRAAIAVTGRLRDLCERPEMGALLEAFRRRA